MDLPLVVAALADANAFIYLLAEAPGVGKHNSGYEQNTLFPIPLEA
jgi:hypothetical protein